MAEIGLSVTGQGGIGSSGGPTDILMLLGEVHEEYYHYDRSRGPNGQASEQC